MAIDKRKLGVLAACCFGLAAMAAQTPPQATKTTTTESNSALSFSSIARQAGMKVFLATIQSTSDEGFTQDHSMFLKDLVMRRRALLVGKVDGSAKEIALLMAKDVEQAQQLFAQDQAVAKGSVKVAFNSISMIADATTVRSASTSTQTPPGTAQKPPTMPPAPGK
jgi:hypothetical protein